MKQFKIPVELASVNFVTCPKQGLEMEAVVLYRVGFLEYFCLNRVRISNPRWHPDTQTWAMVIV